MLTEYFQIFFDLPTPCILLPNFYFNYFLKISVYLLCLSILFHCYIWIYLTLYSDTIHLFIFILVRFCMYVGFRCMEGEVHLNQGVSYCIYWSVGYGVGLALCLPLIILSLCFCSKWLKRLQFQVGWERLKIGLFNSELKEALETCV